MQTALHKTRYASLSGAYHPQIRLAQGRCEPPKLSGEQLFGGEVVQRAPLDLTEFGAFRFSGSFGPALMIYEPARGLEAKSQVLRSEFPGE
jgi:hypothetical protein